MTSAANLPTTEKAALRRHYATLREGIPSEEKRDAEEAILRALFALPAWTTAPLVCGYASLGSELDTLPLWKQATLEGKTYALPVTVTGSREGRMIFRALSVFCPDDLSSGRYGIREPNDRFPALAPHEFSGALILIPGLAFDDEGYRLGYGGGYYDRFLADLRASDVPVTTVGLAFSPCRPATLPREIFDLPVDLIIDERRVIIPHGSSQHP
ncbi:MAG: 5-formyltetrahydrofolate cyclo-ligase [Clostridia bacterium]|nr:5-formyltetrahydrofolate cyclo-ligase [Clostridia bacterium]